LILGGFDRVSKKKQKKTKENKRKQKKQKMQKIILIILLLPINITALPPAKITADKMVKIVQQQSWKIKNHSIDINQLLLPETNAKAEFTLGKVKKHKITYAHSTKTAIYLIGADQSSLKWLKKNKNYLKQIHAIGIITNVHSLAALQQAENAAGEKLLPANLQELSKIIKTNHYPVLIYQRWVMQ